MIIGQTNLPLVHEGAALFNIASFKEIEQMEKDSIDDPTEENLPPWVDVL